MFGHELNVMNMHMANGDSSDDENGNNSIGCGEKDYLPLDVSNTSGEQVSMQDICDVICLMK